VTTSDTVNELAAALAAAQAAMGNARKDSENPHFRSAYADLASVREACIGPLTANGLSVLQSPRTVQTEAGLSVELETRLLHTSGQWLSDVLTVPVSKADAQGVGSAITYARRYSLAAFAGIAPEEDDGEGAVGRPTATQQVVRGPAADRPAASAKPGPISEAQAKRLHAIARESGWSPEGLRVHLERGGILNTLQIQRDDYDTVVAAIKVGPPASNEPIL
jgi:hypothetical protein